MPTARYGKHSQVMVNKLPPGFQFEWDRVRDICCCHPYPPHSVHAHQAYWAFRWSVSYDRQINLCLVLPHYVDFLTLQHIMQFPHKPSLTPGHPRPTCTATMVSRPTLALNELLRQLQVERMPTVYEVEG